MSLMDRQVAMRTARAAGAVGPKAVVPRVVREFANPKHKILDFGAGKAAAHAVAMRKDGYDVTAYDLWHVPGVHDEKALERQYDVVYASNVLNVLNSHKGLHETIRQIHKAVKPNTGMFIGNLPSSPRKDAYKGLSGPQAVAKVERLLLKHFKNVQRLPGHGASPVWVAKEPHANPK